MNHIVCCAIPWASAQTTERLFLPNCDLLCPQQDIEEYANLPDDLCGAAKRWQEWLEFERPEDEPLPGDYYTTKTRSNGI